MCPKYCEKLVYGLLLVLNASTSWLYFSPNEMLAVNRVPIKSSGTIQRLERLALSSFPARAVPGSCTHARWLRSKLSLQRALSNLSQQWMMWECSLQSPRCFQSAGFLLLQPPAPTEFRDPPSTTANIQWKWLKKSHSLRLLLTCCWQDSSPQLTDSSKNTWIKKAVVFLFIIYIY